MKTFTYIFHFQHPMELLENLTTLQIFPGYLDFVDLQEVLQVSPNLPTLLPAVNIPHKGKADRFERCFFIASPLSVIQTEYRLEACAAKNRLPFAYEEI